MISLSQLFLPKQLPFTAIKPEVEVMHPPGAPAERLGGPNPRGRLHSPHVRSSLCWKHYSTRPVTLGTVYSTSIRLEVLQENCVSIRLF